MEEKKKEYGTDIAIISDEPYRELAYEGVDVPFIRIITMIPLCVIHFQSLCLFRESG